MDYLLTIVNSDTRLGHAVRERKRSAMHDSMPGRTCHVIERKGLRDVQYVIQRDPDTANVTKYAEALQTSGATLTTNEVHTKA